MAYVCFGLQRPADHGAGKPSSYLLARLSTSLTELAETPRPVEFLALALTLNLTLTPNPNPNPNP